MFVTWIRAVSQRFITRLVVLLHVTLMNCVIIFDFITKLLYKSYVLLLFRAHIKMAYEECDRDTRAALPCDGERSQETRGAGDVRLDSLCRTWEATT